MEQHKVLGDDGSFLKYNFEKEKDVNLNYVEYL